MPQPVEVFVFGIVTAECAPWLLGIVLANPDDLVAILHLAALRRERDLNVGPGLTRVDPDGDEIGWNGFGNNRAILAKDPGIGFAVRLGMPERRLLPKCPQKKLLKSTNPLVTGLARGYRRQKASGSAGRGFRPPLW